MLSNYFDSNFIVALGAVVPLFLLLLIGVGIRRAHLLTDVELVHVNRMVFCVFFFCMMFYNIYTTDLADTFRPFLMLYGAGAVVLGFIGAMAIVPLFIKDNHRRGAMVQAIFRSNFVLMGIPIVANIFGDNALAVPTMMIAIIVPIFNVLAVFELELFRGGTFNLLKILKGVLHNPMIIGALLGAFFLFCGIHIPEPILKPIRQIGNATSTIALMILGASFRFSSAKEHLKPLIACVFCRLVLLPSIFLPLAVYFGFRGIDLVTLLAIFTTPCAIASYAMAQQMNSDAPLAGNTVVYTSALSPLAIFLWIYAFKSLGYF